MAGAHRMWTKHNMYEQSVSVPLIVRMPDRIEGGASRREIIEQIDLFPTVAELCGLGTPPGFMLLAFKDSGCLKRHLNLLTVGQAAY